MRTTLVLLISAFGFVACVTSGAVNAHTGPGASPQSPEASCPAGSERAYNMVENFLINPNLSDARQETGTSGLNPSQVQLVQDESVCQQLNSEYTQHTGYTTTYYKAGNYYFATLLLKQPDDPQQVVSGISIIVVLNDSLEKIESYGG